MTLMIIYMLCALAGALIALWRSPQLPRYSLLLVIAAVPQVGSIFGIRIAGMFLVSVATIIVWCLANRNLPGVLLVATGAILNLLAMAWHGGKMPVQADVLAGLGLSFDPGTLPYGSKDIVVAASPLWLLSDWLVLSSDVLTLIVSPGDLLVVAGILCWLLLSRQVEKDTPMLAFRVSPVAPERRPRLIQGQSARPALTRLALLAAADPALAQRLLDDPLDAAAAHPHYHVTLDANDRATLASIRSRARTVGEFLGELAAVVDGA